MRVGAVLDRVLVSSRPAQEYRAMAEAAVLGEDDRVEFLGTEIVDMAPVSSRHLACVVVLSQSVYS